MAVLRTYYATTHHCLEDHVGCLGQCAGGVPPRYIPVRLPPKVADMIEGLNFHIAYDGNRWYIRDYDCLINISSPDSEDAIQRFAVQLYLQRVRIKLGQAAIV